ncbi:MAG TPA: glycine cleavage T C-terminal barrel domain-containing protein [Anaerolineales bacterium]|nr:glycine cleavage T C-terminal barrel domain-containing protein [Anaerolineales bacterium]
MEAFSHACYHVTGAGCLRISGADRVDFIQRQSTNDLARLSAERHLATVLTNPAARIIDVLQIFNENDEALGAVTLPGRGPATALFLKKRVFFNDKVVIEDLGGSHRIIDLLGARAGGPTPAPLPETAPGEVRTTSLDGETIKVLGMTGPGGPVLRLVAPAASLPALTGLLERAGFPALSPEQYERLRIEAGLPGAAGELTEEYTPLELGLRDLVSDTKGCYTGQEVIARQITYDKVTRGLAGLRLDGPVRTGARVLAADANVGTLTSYTHSPQAGHIALAVLKRPHTEPGTAVKIADGEGQVDGEVVGLPFVESWRNSRS